MAYKMSNGPLQAKLKMVKGPGKQVTDPPKKTDAELQYDYKLKQAKETIATDNYLNSTVGGKKMKDISSMQDVPKKTSFDGINFNLGYQDGSGSHYYAEGYSSKHGKKGTINRPNDKGHYHVSREVIPTMDNIKTKQANVPTPSSNLRPNTTPPAKMMKNPVTKMAKSMAYASYEGIGKQVTDPPKKGEGKWDYIDKMGPQVDNTPEGRGQATRTVDKIKSAVLAPFSDKTYADFKKDYRDVQKSKHREQKQKREDWLYYHMNRSF